MQKIKHKNTKNQTQNTRAQTQMGVQSGHKKWILVAKLEAATIPFSPNPELAINEQWRVEQPTRKIHFLKWICRGDTAARCWRERMRIERRWDWRLDLGIGIFLRCHHRVGQRHLCPARGAEGLQCRFGRLILVCIREGLWWKRV